MNKKVIQIMNIRLQLSDIRQQIQTCHLERRERSNLRFLTPFEMTKRIAAGLLIVQLFSFPVVVLAQEASGSANIQQVTKESEESNVSNVVSPSPTTSTVSPMSDSGLARMTLEGDQGVIPSVPESLQTDSTKVLETHQVTTTSAVKRKTTTFSRLKKHDYKLEDQVSLSFDKDLDQQVRVEIFDIHGKKIDLGMHTSNFSVKFAGGSSLQPGKYTMKAISTDGVLSEQDFTWGVLALNTDQSVYAPGDVGDIAMAVLDDEGKMVCDANLKLEIRNPKSELMTLTTDDWTIRVSPECQSKAVTDKPDYQTTYIFTDVGTYQLTLTAKTANGTRVLTDSIEVKPSCESPVILGTEGTPESNSVSDPGQVKAIAEIPNSFGARMTPCGVPYEITRHTATRIYPVNTYPVQLTIKANRDFDGDIVDLVPDSFGVTPFNCHPGGNEVTDRIPNRDSIASAFGAVPPEAVTSLQNDSVCPHSYDTVNSITSSQITKHQLVGVAPDSWQMPFKGSHPITLGFGDRLDDDEAARYAAFGLSGHDGVDFDMPIGTPVYAVDDGEVVKSGPSDYGVTVVIQHTWGKSYYGHLSKADMGVGDTVFAGSQIGRSGSTGVSTGGHLHFGVKPTLYDVDNGYFGKIDPLPYMSFDHAIKDKYVFDAQTGFTLDDHLKAITWHVVLRAGEEISLGYSYKAPEVSPYRYTLGPLRFLSAGKCGISDLGDLSNVADADCPQKLDYIEPRLWQIAVDDVSTPTIDQIMRHGTWFDGSGEEKPFTF
jgi:hypothetical protein